MADLVTLTCEGEFVQRFASVDDAKQHAVAALSKTGGTLEIEVISEHGGLVESYMFDCDSSSWAKRA